MEFATLLFEKKENYVIVTLNRPEKLNALNFQLFTELNEAIRQIELDRDIKAVILTGAGEKAFAAGADIMELHESDDITGVHFSQYGSKVMLRLESLRKPVVAAVNGFALGGGCELAMSCHIRFASENAKFGQPEVNLGIIPGYGATQKLPRLVGRAKALELILSGNMIDAYEAERIGLVNKVFPHSELMSKTVEFVQNMLSKGTLAVFSALDCVLSAEHLPYIEGLEYESRMFGKLCGTYDFKEGTKAFLEKRKPNFKGE
ncbi:MAG: enoyl-CoA hydratase-related protein [Ignavibacteria bacterium]|nr:enoyl-CoA hydratase-related protein [Ignavibacteria bacterium]